jgi:hypothetical protein
MANVKNIAKTMRNLVHNAGAWGTGPYMYTVAGSNIIEFYAAANDKSTPYPMAFKPGATIYHDGLYFTATIQGGASHLWTMDQVAENTWNGYQDFYVSDKTAARGRGNTNTPGASFMTIGGLLIPDAVHYIYQSPLDDAGSPDYYVYVDTIQPERGIHPYTRDVAIGSFKTPPRNQYSATARTARPIMDLETRVRMLEGALRAGRAAGSQDSDSRIRDLVARFYAIEQKLNGGSTPSVGSNATYTEDQFMLYGEGGNA